MLTYSLTSLSHCFIALIRSVILSYSSLFLSNILLLYFLVSVEVDSIPRCLTWKSKFTHSTEDFLPTLEMKDKARVVGCLNLYLEKGAAKSNPALRVYTKFLRA